MRKPGYSAALSCVLVRAESAARELGSGVTGTEHLLLALIGGYCVYLLLRRKKKDGCCGDCSRCGGCKK